MAKTDPIFLSIDEAVALLINMDYIPEGFTVTEMVEAFAEEAEAELENAQAEGRPTEAIRMLEIRKDACISRYNLCVSLVDRLTQEVQDPKDSDLMISHDADGTPRITVDSLTDWAADQYGIGFPRYETPNLGTEHQDIAWEDVRIKIKADNRIAWSHEKGRWTTESFEDIGLLNRGTKEPNHQAGILIGLSVGNRFPAAGTTQAQPKDKTAITKLRTSLQTLTGISADPFTRFNPHDGWRPRFKLVDARRDTDKRAEREAPRTTYDDNRSYETENDPTDQWIEEIDEGARK